MELVKNTRSLAPWLLNAFLDQETQLTSGSHKQGTSIPCPKDKVGGRKTSPPSGMGLIQGITDEITTSSNFSVNPKKAEANETVMKLFRPSKLLRGLD